MITLEGKPENTGATTLEQRLKALEMRVAVLEEKAARAKRFVPPTLEEVKKELRDQIRLQGGFFDGGVCDNIAEEFWTYWEASGWVRSGNVKLKDWKSALRNWRKKQKPTVWQGAEKPIYHRPI